MVWLPTRRSRRCTEVAAGTDGVTDRSPRYGAGVMGSRIAEAAFMATVAMVSWMRGVDPRRVVRMPGSLPLGPAAAEPPVRAARLGRELRMHVGLGVRLAHVAYVVVCGLTFQCLQ